MQNTQVIVLAAGKGKRMESDEPKALAMLKEKPFLRHILDTLENINFPIPPIVVVGHKKERVKEVIGEAYKYAHQEEQLGTGHAVASAKDRVHENHDTILVIHVDQPHVSKETILNIIKTHREKKPTITMATVTLPDFSGWREGLYKFGRIIRDKNGNVLKNTEFKDATEEERKITEVNPAFYAFDANWLWKNIDKLKNENNAKEYYLTDLVGLAVAQGEKVETIPAHNIVEGLQPNTKAELEVLEDLLK